MLRTTNITEISKSVVNGIAWRISRLIVDDNKTDPFPEIQYLGKNVIIKRDNGFINFGSFLGNETQNPLLTKNGKTNKEYVKLVERYKCVSNEGSMFNLIQGTNSNDKSRGLYVNPFIFHEVLSFFYPEIYAEIVADILIGKHAKEIKKEERKEKRELKRTSFDDNIFEKQVVISEKQQGVNKTFNMAQLESDQINTLK